MFPWSVIPTASCPSAAAVAMTSGIRAAPSSIENSVCRCRCTNELPKALQPPQPVPTRVVDDPVENHIGVTLTIEGTSASGKRRFRAGSGPPASREERHVHLVGRERAVHPEQLRLLGQGGIDERHRLAGGEDDVAHPAADRALGRGPDPALGEELLPCEHPRLVADRLTRGGGKLGGRPRLRVQIPEARLARIQRHHRSQIGQLDPFPRVDVDLPVVRRDQQRRVRRQRVTQRAPRSCASVNPECRNSLFVTTGIGRPRKAVCRCMSNGSGARWFPEVCQRRMLRTWSPTRIRKPTRPCCDGASPVASDVSALAVVDGATVVIGPPSSPPSSGSRLRCASIPCQPSPSSRSSTTASAPSTQEGIPAAGRPPTRAGIKLVIASPP